MNTVSVALYALFAELRLLLLSCANLAVRTVSALCCMRTSVLLPFALPSQRNNTDMIALKEVPNSGLDSHNSGMALIE